MPEPEILTTFRQEIGEELQGILAPPQGPFSLLRYHMGWEDEQGRHQKSEGKMLRPLLCLLACRAVGGDYRRALPAAAAIELVHNFSLIHDDIEDASPLRRHRPTVWKVWGQPLAINAGDAMLVLAHLALLRLLGRGVPAEMVVHACTILDTACLELCQGQHQDLTFESRREVSLEEYSQMVSGKTAALFEAAFHLGAFLGEARESQVRSLAAFGKKLGMAFQVQDDAQAIWGKAKATGKVIGEDIYARKKSLPIVYALARATGQERQELERLYRLEKLAEPDVARVLDILNSLAAQSYTQGIMKKLYHDARQELEASGLPEEAARELSQVVSLLVPVARF